MAAPVIYGPDGTALPPGAGQRARVKALIGGGSSPFDAADRTSAEMSGWNPWLGSPDTETTPYRDISVARIRDLVRNDGWAAGTVTKMVDAAIGADFRLMALPDYRSLARRFGKGFDAVWAKEFRAAAEAGFRAWSEDPSRYWDVERKHTFSQKMALGFRHYAVEGEAIVTFPWREDRRGYGKARYASTVQMIDPDRLGNPNMRMDSLDMRGGVEIDADGVAIAYHFRKAHMNDWFAAGRSVQWERVPRETDWGRPMVAHFYDSERAGDHRPVGGIFTPVLARLRMLAQYDRLEVQAAIINAIFGAYIESPFDSADVQKAIDEDDGEQVSTYQRLRSEYHQDNRLVAGNVRLATLFPGEKINTIGGSRPAAAFDMFEGAMLRNLASATGNSYETVSADYRKSTYSSARQAMLESWKTMSRRRDNYAQAIAKPAYGNLLEEMIDRGEVPLPAGAPDFAEARAEYTRCNWVGPGRGWIDPVKEPEGARLKIASGLSTLQREAADGDGLDWEEVLDQRQIEEEAVRERGLTLTFAVTGGEQPDTAEVKPEDEKTEGQDA